MRKNFFEDFLLNKLNGYYLILYGKNHHRLAKLVFLFEQTVVYLLVVTRLIPPRIHSYQKR